jgi:hypothetical protein
MLLQKNKKCITLKQISTKGLEEHFSFLSWQAKEDLFQLKMEKK